MQWQSEAERRKKVQEEVDWGKYFSSIREVCPWSSAAWRNNGIRILKWYNHVEDLGEDQAIVYLTTKHTPRQLKKITKRLNQTHTQWEFLWSHPRYQYHSTPVPVIIQQDRATLENLRKRINYTP